MSDSVEMQPLSTREAVLKMLESQRTRLERWKAARVREIELDGPGELPSTTVMIRCFGGTRSIDVQLGAEAILQAVGEPTA